MATLAEKLKNAQDGVLDKQEVEDVPLEPIDSIMKDFPSGPLTPYRKKARFDWRKMKMFVEGEDVIRFRVRFFYWKGLY